MYIYIYIYICVYVYMCENIVQQSMNFFLGAKPAQDE
jgi:hypothetical protein